MHAKSKIVSQKDKKRAIVDLELLAMYESTKRLYKLVEIFNFKGKMHLFTDSMINAERLKSSLDRSSIVVARRLLSILKFGSLLKIQFHHNK